MKVPLGLHTHASVSGVRDVEIFKVLSPEEAAAGAYPLSDVLLSDSKAEITSANHGISSVDRRVRVQSLRNPNVVKPGDVVRLRENSSLVSVLYRRGSAANTLFATERCNSRCLMCSQPPREDDDSWRVAELMRVIELSDCDEIQLGISGGEPTLLGGDLARLIDKAGDHLPQTTLHILTNGRLFADRPFAEMLARRRKEHVVWAVPLYADVAELHDEIVDAHGAFSETMSGLYELGRIGARVEIRVVLHALSVPRLPQLASLIYRRLPFVEHVALMGLEPMGFAKQNRQRLWIDPVDYTSALENSVYYLSARGITVSIYNLPLCILPVTLRPFAQQSISDWKNMYPDECRGCAALDTCSGFFASAGPDWRSRSVKPILQEETV
jgi:His-Xaa-Ser system radical SAM maturase HxsC